MKKLKRKCVVLVVDDDHEIREVMDVVLGTAGFDVKLASEGGEALALLRSGLRPNVIVLDLMMPGMNGWQFRSEQIKDPQIAAIPVVVLSGDGNVADKATRLSATGILRKPVELATLVDTISQACAPS